MTNMRTVKQSPVGIPTMHHSADSDNVVHLVAQSAPYLEYYLYMPCTMAPARNILVAVHGISRNAREQINLFRIWADRFGVALVAPLFSHEVFSDYQRLGRRGLGPRADLALIRLLNEVSRYTGIDSSKVDMFGFSGGAQFAHRFAFAYPQRIRCLALGAAGWYTMPDRSVPFPYGIANAKGLEPVQFSPTAIARLPILVAVGQNDNKKDDEELNRSRAICAAQGASRLERAHAWTNRMNAFAARWSSAGHVELMVLPRTGHSFSQAVSRGGLAKKLFERFYAESRTMQ